MHLLLELEVKILQELPASSFNRKIKSCKLITPLPKYKFFLTAPFALSETRALCVHDTI
jgi:hypothetical protein